MQSDGTNSSPCIIIGSSSPPDATFDGDPSRIDSSSDTTFQRADGPSDTTTPQFDDGALIDAADSTDIQMCVPPPGVAPRFTEYTGVGHNALTRTYDLSGMGTAVQAGRTPYTLSMYDWLLQHQRP